MADLIYENDVYGDIQFIKKINQGAQAEVWQAFQSGVDRFVAVKVAFPTDKIISEEEQAAWKKEGEVWARFNDPNIATLHYPDVVKHTQRDLMLKMYVMELAECSLKEKIESGGNELILLLKWMENISHAIWVAHSRNPKIIHRDIKPTNVLLFPFLGGEMIAKVSDFGIAKYETDEPSLNWIGTPPYAAPEQAEGHFSPASDVYGLGMTFLFMLLGDRKFKNSLRGHGDEKVFLRQNISTVAPDLEKDSYSKNLLDLIEEMTQQAPAKRCAIATVQIKLRKLIALYENNYKSTKEHEMLNKKNSIRNKLIWNPQIHEEFQEKIHYFIIRAFLSIREIKSGISGLLDGLLDKRYCIYEVFGTDDIILRVWCNDVILRELEHKIKTIQSMLAAGISYFQVTNYKYLFAKEDVYRPISDVRTKMNAALSGENPIKNLIEGHLAIETIQEINPSSYRAFTTVTTNKRPLKKNDYDKILSDIEGQTSSWDGIYHISVYFGTLTSPDNERPCILIKYYARQYYAILKLPYHLHQNNELNQLGMRTDTYLVATDTIHQSDDGPFIEQDWSF